MPVLGVPQTRPSIRAQTGSCVVLCIVLLVVAAMLGVGAQSADAQEEVPHVLVWSGTYGFRHPSIMHGNEVIQSLADETGAFTVEFTENPLDLNADKLAGVDVLLWNNTTGKPPFTAQQRDEIIRYAYCGGGNIGIHAAADANYAWPEHAELWGAQFDSHPKNAGDGEIRMLIEEPAHPVTSGWEGATEFMLDDELYRWRAATGLPGMSLPRNLPDTRVLLSLDETTLDESVQEGPTAYERHQPMAWTKTFRGGGRVYYNNMGHGDASWDLPAFRRSLVDGVLWTSELDLDTDCLHGDEPLPPPPSQAPTPPVNAPTPPCTVPEVAPRSGPPWQTSGEAKALTEDGDEMEMPGVGFPGGLGWAAQAYVLDLSGSGARTADLTFDLTWPVPADDYDLSATLPWGWAGSQELLGPEQIVVEDVPHCTVFKVFAENVLAVSQQPATLTATVTPSTLDAGPPADDRQADTADGAPTAPSDGDVSAVRAGTLPATGGSAFAGVPLILTALRLLGGGGR